VQIMAFDACKAGFVRLASIKSETWCRGTVGIAFKRNQRQAKTPLVSGTTQNVL